MKPTPAQIALAKRVPYSVRDIAEAIAAAEERAVAAERAAIVAFLRSELDELYRRMIDPHSTDVTSTRAQTMREALAFRADRIERGDHHPKEQA